MSTRSSQKRNHYTADINKSSTNPDLNKTSSDKCIYEYSQVTHSRLHFTIEGRDDVMTPKMFGGQEGQEVREEVHWHWLGSIQKVGHPRRHFHNDCVKLQWHWESNKPLITTPFPALTTQASRRQWWRIKSKCLRKSRECSESPANKCWVCKMCCQSRTPANWWSNFSLGISSASIFLYRSLEDSLWNCLTTMQVQKTRGWRIWNN